MRVCFFFISSLLLFVSCNRPSEINKLKSPKVDWESRTVTLSSDSEMIHGTSYLSMYSQIYSQSMEKTYGLTNTISIRNTSSVDSVYMHKIDFYDANGEVVRKYIEKSIFLKPMETVEIIIDQKDRIGGTGGNFLFDWSIPNNSSEPLFEAVMISTYNGQGLSFVTQGVRTK